MSIISEALKKAEIPSPIIPKYGPEKSGDKKETKSRGIKKPLNKKWVFAASAAVISIIVSAYFISYYFLNKKVIVNKAEAAKEPLAAPSAPSEKAQAEVVKKEKPLAASAMPLLLTIDEVDKAINLTGIMYTPKKPLAVINGDIWGESERVGKFQILEIREDFIKVGSGNQTFIVRLKR